MRKITNINKIEQNALELNNELEKLKPIFELNSDMGKQLCEELKKLNVCIKNRDKDSYNKQKIYVIKLKNNIRLPNK